MVTKDTRHRLTVTLVTFLFAIALIFISVLVRDNQNLSDTLYSLQSQYNALDSNYTEQSAQVASLLTQVTTFQTYTQDLEQALDLANLSLEENLTTYMGTYSSTAFTLQECSKKPGDYGYGITASGIDLNNLSIDNARYIGVDPDIMPYYSKYLIIFPEPYSYLTGIYTAADTGSNYHGKKIDVFFGESNVSEALQYGRRDVEVYRWNQ